jgi:hypothetical protein
MLSHIRSNLLFAAAFAIASISVSSANAHAEDISATPRDPLSTKEKAIQSAVATAEVAGGFKLVVKTIDHELDRAVHGRRLESLLRTGENKAFVRELRNAPKYGNLKLLGGVLGLAVVVDGALRGYGALSDEFDPDISPVVQMIAGTTRSIKKTSDDSEYLGSSPNENPSRANEARD